MRAIVTGFIRDESGATGIEYALIAGIIGLGIIVALSAITDGLNMRFTSIKTELSK